MRNVLIAVCLVAVSFQPVRAGDIATERTQAATAAILTFIQQANEQIENFTDKIRGFEESAAKLMELDRWRDVDVLDDVFDVYQGIEQIIQEGDALAHTAQDTEQFFRDRYDDYNGFYDALTTRGYIDEQPVIDRLKQWNETHRSTIMNTLRAHGIHADQVASGEQRLALLQDRSRTADGRMQVLQVGQEIAAEEIKQLHGLKEILMEQSNLHSSYFAYSAAMTADQEAHGEFLRRDVMPTIIGNEVGAILP